MQLEKIRAKIRKYAPRRFYNGMAHILDVVSVLRKGGLSAYSALYNLDGADTECKFRPLAHPLSYRRTEDHVNAIIQNIFRGEYDAFAPKSAYIIIDGGAFIGDLSCHWATTYPEAQIIAFEPNRENYAFAEINARRYGTRIKLVNKGLWSHPCRLKVLNNEMSSYVREVSGDEYDVEATSIEQVLKEYNIRRVDLLKLDIEGAEKMVIGDGMERWIESVGQVVVECHGGEIEKNIVDRLKNYGFAARHHRSLITFRRTDCL